MRLRALVLTSAIFLVGQSATSAQEPQWWGVVVARGADQARIDATPVAERPYRPFHFYGNTVRRQYYRGSPLPLPRDVTMGAQAFLFRRRWTN